MNEFMHGVKRIECNERGLITAIEFYEEVNGNYIAQALYNCNIPVTSPTSDAFTKPLKQRKRFIVILEDDED